MKIKLAHADDHTIFLKGVVLGLQKADLNKTIEFIYNAHNGQELLDKLEANPLPDIILMDLRMPIMDGFEATKRIINQFPSIKIIIFTMYDDINSINHFKALGVHGYLLKLTQPESLLNAIHDVFNGKFAFQQALPKSFID